MSEKYGIENLKGLFKFGMTLGQTISEDLKDSKITLPEVFGLLPQLMQISDFIAHKDDIINEAKDLSLEEVKELTRDIEGVITNEKVVAVIEDAVNTIVSIKGLIESVKNLVTKDEGNKEPDTNPDGTEKE